MPAVINILFIIQLVVSIMLLIGFKSRLASILTWFFVISLIARNPMVVTGGYVIFRLGLFWAMFLPLGARWSVDSALNRIAENPSKIMDNRFLSPSTIGIIVQVIATYVFAGFHKNDPIWDKDFTGIYYSLHIDQFATEFGKFLLNFPSLLELNTMFVVYVQRYGVILFLIPVKNNYFKVLGILVFSFFHVGLNLSMNIGWFQIIAMVMLVIFIPPETWNFIHKKIATRKRKGLKIYYDSTCSFCMRIVFIIATFFLIPQTKVLPASIDKKTTDLMDSENSWIVKDYRGKVKLRFEGLMYVFSMSPLLFPLKYLTKWESFNKFGENCYKYVANRRESLSRATDFLQFKRVQVGTPWPVLVHLIAIGVTIYCILWNVAAMDRWSPEEEKDSIDVPASIYWFGPSFQVNQYWGLFSPAPMKDDGWYVISAITKGGRQFDLFTEEDLTWDKPEKVTKQFVNDRWRKYIMNMWLGQFQDHRVHYGRYLCREYNAKNFGDDQVNQFYMYYMLEETPPPGEPFPELKSALLHEHSCFLPKEENGAG